MYNKIFLLIFDKVWTQIPRNSAAIKTSKPSSGGIGNPGIIFFLAFIYLAL